MSELEEGNVPEGAREAQADGERSPGPKPTVSKEQWIGHARKKLVRGYVLIVNDTRHNANFFMPGKGYEMCSYQTARQLVKDGVVVAAGTHYLGTVYKLAASVASEPKQPVASG